MTAFIQLWESRRVPERVMKLIPEYNGQDVIFVPENTNSIDLRTPYTHFTIT